jgi:predicted RNA-binding Zn-ribbon protein involved in translation (DUF1610 family)
MPLVLRRDEAYHRRCRLALAAIVLGMPVVLAAWALIPMSAHIGWKLLPMLLWLASSAILGDIAFVRPLRSYHCPRCGRELPRSEQARPWIRFRCEPCGVEWDVNRSEGDGGGE